MCDSTISGMYAAIYFYKGFAFLLRIYARLLLPKSKAKKKVATKFILQSQGKCVDE